MQQKGELEAEERRKYELESQTLGYELDGESRALELPLTESGTRAPIPSSRQELTGDESARELETPGGEAESRP